LNNQSVQNKPTTAYIVSLLGGVFGLLGSLAFIAFGVLAYLALSSFGEITNGGLEILFGWGWTTLLGLGLWIMIASILVIVSAFKLKANPMEHAKWGALILVFSIIGLWSLLGLIGGILALVYKPLPAGQAKPIGYGPSPQESHGQQQQYYNQPAPVLTSQPMTRICPQCGRMVDENVKYCPYCCKALG
jgi:hypothetical protein